MDRKYGKIILGILLFIIGLSPFLYWIFEYLNHDVWFDEIRSLKEYAVTDFKTIFTTFGDTNHHVLLNLINHILLLILDVHDVYKALDYVYILRALQVIFTFITITYSFLIVRKFFNRNYAILAVALLTSCIPFLNFSLQLRGYNISMMWMVLVIYYVWSYIDYRRLKDLILCNIFISLFLYTLPSNIYYITAFGVIVIVEWIRRSLLYKKELNSLRKDETELRKHKSVFAKVGKPYVYLGIAFIITFIFTYLAYTPVLESILTDRYVNQKPLERTIYLTNELPRIMTHFLSKRWLLLLFIPLVLWLKFKNKRTYSNEDRLYLLVLVLILPFIFAFIQNIRSYDRIFLPLAPVFAIVLAELIAFVLEKLHLKKKVKKIILPLICIYAVVTSFVQINENQKILRANYTNEIKEYNLYRNFFLANDFRPHKVAKTLANYNDNKKVAILVDQIDRVSLLIYLEKYHIKSSSVVYIKKIEKTKKEEKMQVARHAVLFQQSMGKHKKTEFRMMRLDLPTGFKFNNYYVMFKYVNYLEEKDNHREKDLFMLAGYHEKAKEFIRTYKKDFKINLLDDSNFVHIYKLERAL